MSAHGIEVDIHTLSKRWILFAKIDMIIWKTVGISFLSFLRLFIIIKTNSNIIYGSNIFLPKLVRKKLGLQAIGWFPDFQVHDLPHYFSKRQKIRRLSYEKKMFKTCDQIVVQNIADQDRLQKVISTTPILLFSFYETRKMSGNTTEFNSLEFTAQEDFILVAAQGWAHKRIDKVIESYSKSSKKIKLVIIGKLHDQRDLEYTKRLNQLMISTDVSFLGFVSENKKIQLFQKSLAVLNFSEYEGWNSSVEEALAYEKPLILSDTHFHRDQVGNALFVDSVDELTLIFSGVTDIENKIDYYGQKRRRLKTVKNFIKALETL
ncbi:glycosyltransferase [Amylibacter sp.]|nr:glycosyltransferase [Amylibacter sp.]